MKPDTHPDYHSVKVIMTDGTGSPRTTWGKQATRSPSTSTESHPAWTGAAAAARPRRPAFAFRRNSPDRRQSKPPRTRSESNPAIGRG